MPASSHFICLFLDLETQGQIQVGAKKLRHTHPPARCILSFLPHVAGIGRDIYVQENNQD